MIADRWGVTIAETQRRYPCDELVGDPTLECWRGVTVQAPPGAVWQRVIQIRLAPYSYDWIDNLGRRSPRELGDLRDPEAGEPFTTALGGIRCGRVLATAAGEHLTAEIMGATLSYLLVPSGANTRLLLKIVARSGRLVGPLFAVGDLIMSRRQLLNLARLAEQDARTSRG